jgi:hypothetical protein
MNIKTVVASVVCAASLAVLPSGTASAYGSDDCYNGVSTAEWYNLQVGLDNPPARRAVVEADWGVMPQGYRNQYWVPGSDLYYSLAYKFCQNKDLLIVIVYRKSSGAWQMALKGAFGTVS